MINLRDLGKALNEAMKCPACGKSIMVKAIGHRGHGTGQNGTVHYSATAFENVTTNTHCTCPGGPCDLRGLLPAPVVPASEPVQVGQPSGTTGAAQPAADVHPSS